MNLDISSLRQQVQHNCDISDATYGGMYSLCGLLLRMRDLYKWEAGLPPWREPEPARLLQWIDEREAHWDSVSQREFQHLTLDSQRYDPFDFETINARLRPLGYVYGAGYAAGMKPSFFLAELVDSRTDGALHIDVVDRELARDLFIAPAMRQGEQIFARRSAMLFSIWDQIMEMRPSTREALFFALAQHDLDARQIRSQPEELGPQLQRVAQFELETWIHHEIGEVREDAFDGYLWHEIVSTYANSPIELFARVLKDLLADTHEEGLLGHIVESRKRSSLGFYVSFMRPFSRVMFPQAIEAFRVFQATGDWSVVSSARERCYAGVHGRARELIRYHLEGRQRGVEWARSEILANLIEPLGILNALDEDAAGED